MTRGVHVYGNRGGGWLPRGDFTPGEGVADLARIKAEHGIGENVPTGCDTEDAEEQLELFGDA